MNKLAEAGIKLPPGWVGLKDQKRIYKALGCPPTVSKNDYRNV